MGVPAFFRWLSRKYPSVIAYCVETKPEEIGGIKIPVDSSLPNPNGVEFDNLYLDMNGIIHPCTHPEDKPPPKDEDEMMVAIFECIDRLFSIVRPRKLLYMAIDGVAPRAKMNQQRSRRFRASKESIEKNEEISRLRTKLSDEGSFLPPEKPKESQFDSNCITPGTPFMDRLSKCLHYYIHERLNNDPGWKGIKVILSDANVPGEGEHKIMDFIRRQRAQPDHDPNTQHCLCGADADLIMLGLATHEPNFTIIREEFRANKPKPCDLCHQLGHEMKDCTGLSKPVVGNVTEITTFGEEVPFIFVRLNVLREYLEEELVMPDLPFPYDFERVVDDWVFMCFFVGNDFLPHLPSLEIREGAINRLINLYKSCVYKTGGFVTDSGEVVLSRVQIILNELGMVEDEIFKKRRQNEQMFKEREKQRKKLALESVDCEPTTILGGQYAPTPLGVGMEPSVIENPRLEAYKGRLQGLHSNAALESLIRPEDKTSEPSSSGGGGVGLSKRSLEELDDEIHDEVRLWEEGFKDRYYESKFDVGKENVEFRIRIAHEYVRGLCWVLRYYYQGCASWKWFFPYHYAPFASDFVNIEDLDTRFEEGTQPFRPLEQLMGVFPAASSSHVPKPWAALMCDPDSPIIDFYPTDFKIDLNGKKFAWQGVALLPFVDERRLFKALKPYYNLLTPAEKKRNVCGDDRVYVGTGNKGYTFMKAIYEKRGPQGEEIDFCFEGMRGKVLQSNDCIDLCGMLRSPVRNLPAINENMVICARFRNLTYSANYVFKAKRLKGVIRPPRVLKPGDLTPLQNRNWRPQIGMAPRVDRATLDSSGHRMLDHYNNSFQKYNQNLTQYPQQESGKGFYSQVPPPSSILFEPNAFAPLIQNYGYRTVQNSSGGAGSSSGSRGNSTWSNSDQHRFTDSKSGSGSGSGYGYGYGYHGYSERNDFNRSYNNRGFNEGNVRRHDRMAQDNYYGSIGNYSSARINYGYHGAERSDPARDRRNDRNRVREGDRDRARGRDRGGRGGGGGGSYRRNDGRSNNFSRGYNSTGY